MKIVCDRKQLSDAFATAAMVAPSRSPKAILQNVKLEAIEQGAQLMASDLEFSVRLNVPQVQVSRGGAIVLPVARFNSILRESTAEKLTIEANDRGIVVKADRSEFRFPTINADEFPSVPHFKDEKYHVVAAPLFRQIVQRTEFATDTESGRFALGGVLLELEGGRITAVGTDGRRLAKMEGPAEAVGGHSTVDSQTIVRTASMRLLGRSIVDSDEYVHIAARGNDIVFRTPKAVFHSRLVEGRFPRWRDVIPTRPDAQRIDLVVEPFFAAVRQAAILASDETKGVDFEFSEGTLTLQAVSAEHGESKVELPVTYAGPAVGATLDHKFVADFLKVLPGDKLFTLEIENEDQAVVCTTDDGYSYVIMPLGREKRRRAAKAQEATA